MGILCKENNLVNLFIALFFRQLGALDPSSH